MSSSSRTQGVFSPSRPKLSISTVYPIELPKLKFYTQRAIHEDPSNDHNPIRQIPVTFIRYMRNKQKRRYSSRTEPALPLAVYDSMLITNSMQRDRVKDEHRQGLVQKKMTKEEEERVRFTNLLQKVGNAAKEKLERQEKSKLLLNYYKKKYLKYKCRKSIDLDPSRMQTIRKTPKKDDLLADGLKIEKIQFAQTPKNKGEIINKAKFNTLACQQGGRKTKKWEIGPWNLHSDPQAYD